MNCALVRTKWGLYGVFGELSALSGDPICVTGEHAYLCSNGLTYAPKLAAGTYTCKRRLSPKFGYDVFIVENVPDFQGSPVTFLEIHRGNYCQTDSDGCILLASSLGVGCVLESQAAFDAFMVLQAGCDSFTLTVA